MSKRDEVGAGILAVLNNHGYDLPGVADICAGAAIRILREPSTAQTDAMARQINRVAGFGNVSGRDVYQAAIDAAESDR